MCAYWSGWNVFSLCAVSCGGGERVRQRICIGGEAGSRGCEGSDEDIDICRTQVEWVERALNDFARCIDLILCKF